MFSPVNIKSAAARQSDAIYGAPALKIFGENDESMKLYVCECYVVLMLRVRSILVPR